MNPTNTRRHRKVRTQTHTSTHTHTHTQHTTHNAHKNANHTHTHIPHPQVHKAVIVETKTGVQRADGSVLRFAKNACVLVNAKGQPLGTRVLGFATHELRARQLMKVLSLAARVL